MDQPAFSRAEPDARRQSLIEAAARVLAERGASGLSVRHVAAAAGVSPGLVSHYFDGVDDLVAATYLHVSARVTFALQTALDAAGDDPLTRLITYVTTNFVPPIADADLLATWIAFWSLVRTHPAIARLHAEIYSAYRHTIEALLAQCCVNEAVDQRYNAIAITALIDGLWLELCLAPTALSAEDACVIAREQIIALVAPGHLHHPQKSRIEMLS